MSNYINSFLLNDGMYVEEEKCWFLSACDSELFWWDRDNGELRFVSQVPNAFGRWRWVNRCVKNDNVVYCFPENGDTIWAYDLKKGTWKNLFCEEKGKRLKCVQCWVNNNEIYAYSAGLKRIIRLCLSNGEVSIIELNKYRNIYISDRYGKINKYGDEYYIPSCDRSVVFHYDRDFSLLEEIIFDRDIGGNNLCLRDDEGYLLAGYSKSIRRIKKNGKIVKSIELPNDFGVYTGWYPNYNKTLNDSKTLDTNFGVSDYPLFNNVVLVNDKVWFIPLFSKDIIIVDFLMDIAEKFQITEELENERSINNRIINGKYILEYVIDERFIGVYSIKTERIIEIDTESMDYRFLNVFLDYETYSHFEEVYGLNYNILHECGDNKLYSFLMDSLYPAKKFRNEIKHLSVK